LLRQALIAVACGLLHAVSLATPWDGQPSGWLQLLALGGLAWQLERCTAPSRAALLGGLFGTAWLGGTFWWLFIAMNTYGGLAAPLAFLAVLALAAVLSLYYAAAGAAFVALAPSKRWCGCVFAALWLMAELARGQWFTGFGWGGAAYAHTGALVHAAPYVGAYGMAALVAFVAYALADWLHEPTQPVKVAMAFLAACVLAAMASLPTSFTTAGPTLQVALLQGNIPQNQKFESGTGIAESLRWYREQLAASTASLVVAPETAVPLLPGQLPPGYWQGLRHRFGDGAQAALIGVPLGSAESGYTNSVVGLRAPVAPAGEASDYRYDKHHLVPFGEFIPPLFRWFTSMMDIPLGDFNAGATGQDSFHWQGQRLAPNVCYEDLFGEELGRRFIDPASAPTIFVNVSNIAWFGNSLAIDQHLQISRMRAIEFGRPFIRATNTGETAIIDHNGRLTQSLQRHTRGVLQGSVQGREGITPYAWWVSRYGLWPLWLLAGLVLLGSFALRPGRRSWRWRTRH
jgi:apolipoprotein N-acyltransferase